MQWRPRLKLQPLIWEGHAVMIGVLLLDRRLTLVGSLSLMRPLLGLWVLGRRRTSPPGVIVAVGVLQVPMGRSRCAGEALMLRPV